MDTRAPVRPGGLRGMSSGPVVVTSSGRNEAAVSVRAMELAATTAPAVPRPALRKRRRSGSATSSPRRGSSAWYAIALLPRFTGTGALVQHVLDLSLGGIDREAVRQPGHRIVVPERDLVRLLPRVGCRGRAGRAPGNPLAV